jgi:hypothetical protein
VHWAYARPTRPAPPATRDTTWARTDIDRFILARLEQEGLRPSPEASREALLRRVSLDLTGLPPTLEQIDAFLADTRPDAYERVVDALLASPHYGERWARPWLDLARYADSHGYEKDGLRTMWKYRDWVIDALNRDMPFDQFTIEQIAGDMLPDATDAQRVATGLPPEHAPQPGGRHRRRGGAVGDAGRSRQHHRHRLARIDDRLRAVPQPQVRPVLAARLLPDARVLRQRRVLGRRADRRRSLDPRAAARSPHARAGRDARRTSRRGLTPCASS